MVRPRRNANPDGRQLFARWSGGWSRQSLDASAGLLDRLDGALGRPVNLEIGLCLQFAVAQDLDAVPRARDNARLDQRRNVDRPGRIQLARVDRGLNAAQIDLVQIAGRRRGEAALGQAPMQRHLAALEAFDAHARTRRLALAAASGLLALARTDAATDANPRLRGPVLVLDFVEFHGGILYFPSTTRTRWATLAIMPRTAGVSSTRARRPILSRPRPFSVAR